MGTVDRSAVTGDGPWEAATIRTWTEAAIRTTTTTSAIQAMDTEEQERALDAAFIWTASIVVLCLEGNLCKCPDAMKWHMISGKVVPQSQRNQQVLWQNFKWLHWIGGCNNSAGKQICWIKLCSGLNLGMLNAALAEEIDGNVYLSVTKKIAPWQIIF